VKGIPLTACFSFMAMEDFLKFVTDIESGNRLVLKLLSIQTAQFRNGTKKSSGKKGENKKKENSKETDATEQRYQKAVKKLQSLCRNSFPLCSHHIDILLEANISIVRSRRRFRVILNCHHFSRRS
jgi:hypothetical protein